MATAVTSVIVRVKQFDIKTETPESRIEMAERKTSGRKGRDGTISSVDTHVAHVGLVVGWHGDREGDTHDHGHGNHRFETVRHFGGRSK